MKKKTTVARSSVVRKPKLNAADLPRLAQDLTEEHWDPRVTIYEADPRKLKDLATEPDFTKTHPDVKPWRPGGWFVVGAFWIREFGSRPDLKTSLPRRIVEVRDEKPSEIIEAERRALQEKERAREARRLAKLEAAAEE